MDETGVYFCCLILLLLLVMQKDDLEGSSIDLEEMCLKYLEIW